MTVPTWSGRHRRLSRMSRPRDGRWVVVPLDHSLSTGPITAARSLPALVDAVVSGGADAVVVHKGRVRTLDPELLGPAALVVHLSGGTVRAPDSDDRVLVGGVEEAVALGADAVSVHVNLGSDTEPRQLADLGTVAGQADRLGIPLLAMIYPRGRRIADPTAPSVLAHAVNVAADLGADAVKTLLPLHPDAIAVVVESSPIPVLAAGGDGGGDLATFARAAVNGGCRGLAIGRRVFQADDPESAVREVVSVVHEPVANPLDRTSFDALAGVM